MSRPLPPILTETVLALPLMIAVGWLVGDGPLAVGVAISGVAVIVNMAILAWLSSGYISSIVSNGSGGFAAVGVILKFWLSMYVFWLVMTRFGPLSVFLSWISVVLGVAGRGIWLYVRGSTDEFVEELT